MFVFKLVKIGNHLPFILNAPLCLGQAVAEEDYALTGAVYSYL